MRLRNLIIMKAILRSGVANPESIALALLKEMYKVVNRPGHYLAFISLLGDAASGEAATETYANISAPVCLVGAPRIGPDQASVNTIAARYRAPSS